MVENDGGGITKGCSKTRGRRMLASRGGSPLARKVAGIGGTEKARTAHGVRAVAVQQIS